MIDNEGNQVLGNSTIIDAFKLVCKSTVSDLCRNLASFIILVRLILCYEVIVHFLFYCSAALSLTLNMVFKCFLRIVFSFLTCFSVEHLSGMN